MAQHTNRLAAESSPYLLQHAHNPVDWYPWGDEAFEKARLEDKPVLVSIGYAACHWCHVMERESFEDEQVAALMNREFVNIKVDREERPDVDQVYMDAVQAISGSGGWPLNVFLTPDRKPFYGGTYFPPRRAFNRSSWTEVITAIADAYKNRRDEVAQQADNLVQHLETSNSFGLKAHAGAADAGAIHQAFGQVMSQTDTQWGGFGRAPKFPQSFTINFLLRYAHFFKKEEALEQAEKSLQKMIYGGIYDQLGGGFARYATDGEWLVPHFEKMLYDNALLVISMSGACQLTGGEVYKKAIGETMDFIKREMMHPRGGFYSALDADSEGQEGKFYTWYWEELQTLLGADAPVFCQFYGATPDGNWNEHGHEGRNILWIAKPEEAFAEEQQVSVSELQALLERCRQVLWTQREKRVRPGLDDKVLLGWNALMNVACSHAYAATGRLDYLQLARANMDFLLGAFQVEGAWRHTWKNDEARYPAFLDDLACLCAALVELGSVSGHLPYFDKAAGLMEYVCEHFSDDDGLFFYYTPAAEKDLPVRKKEIYDGATPSGNSMMAENLLKLGILFDNPSWRERGQKMLGAMAGFTPRYPTSFGHWLTVQLDVLQGFNEIAITGKNPEAVSRQLLSHFIPNRVLMIADEPTEAYPLLAGKPVGGENHMYLCKNYACRQPVFTVGEFVKLLSSR